MGAIGLLLRCCACIWATQFFECTQGAEDRVVRREARGVKFFLVDAT